MWDQLRKMPPILVGQSILNFLELKSIVRLESALASSERIQILRSFLCYLSKVDDEEVLIPDEMSKLEWLQSHDLPISKTVVHLNKIHAKFETKLIKEIWLVDHCSITSATLNYLPGCYEKIVSVYFYYIQEVDVMEELFSRLLNVRELNTEIWSDDWIHSAIRRLHRESNNNVLIENISITMIYDREGSVTEIAKYCPRLKSLTVSFSIAEDSLSALSTYCPLLEELNIPHFPSISTEQSAELCAPALSCIHKLATPYAVGLDETPHYARTVPYLTELRDINAKGPIDHVLLPLLSQYCLKLEEVEIMDTSTTTPAQLLQLAQNCRHLHTVYIAGDHFSTDELIIGLAERCPNLQVLSLSLYH